MGFSLLAILPTEVEMNKATFICPCCGYNGLASPPYSKMDDPTIRSTDGVTPPYATMFGMPSYEVCECCGFEFGNDDEPGTSEPVSFSHYRALWIKQDWPWFSPDKKPPNWDLEKQLCNIGLFPDSK